MQAMTGLELARRSGARVIVGSDNAYAWRERVIVLTERVAMGSDAFALAIAAHESAHHHQPRWMFWLRWLEPVRMHCELDAWRRAMVILEEITPRRSA